MCVCACVCIFIIYWAVEGHLDWFHFPDTMNRAAMNMAKQVPVEEDVDSFGHLPKGVELSHMVDLFLLSENSPPKNLRAK